MSGQDEPDPVSCKEHFPENHYNKSFIDQVCLVKMAGYWPHSFFFCKFMDLQKEVVLA